MLYGKWRPRRFSEVGLHDHMVTTVRNALVTGQVAHAYLFTGPRGTGKTTMARLLAKAVNCTDLQDGEPCNACTACQAINEGSALDLVEMDAASNRGIDDIRNLRERIGFAPSDLYRKVYLLDEVHMLTEGAFNALLKTLEEPPPHAIFILATTDLQKVPKTIVSRCQRFDFRRVPNEVIVERLAYICEQEGFEVPPDALRLMAVQSRGGLRDAITLIEQVIAQTSTTPTLEDVEASLGLVRDARAEQLARAVLDEDLVTALQVCREVGADGVDVGRFARATVDLLRDRLGEIVDAASGSQGKPDRDEVRSLLYAIDRIATADYRRDPASVVPLEVAVTAAILGPETPAAAPAQQASQPAPQRGPQQQKGPQQRQQRRPQRQSGGQQQDDGEGSREERFLKALISACRATSVKLAAYMNGSCEVVSMDGEELVLGCYFEFHQQNIEREGRHIIEEEASRLLDRPVRLKLTQIERQNARGQREPRGGHLTEEARKLGAIPVKTE